MTAPLVLLVDDDAELGEALQFILEREGYRTHWVRDASVALDVIPALHPALVVTELMLPVMGGIELIGNAPRMMVMASSWQLLRQAQDHGADSVIHKPFGPEVFLNRVVELLRPGPLSVSTDTAASGPSFDLPGVILPVCEGRDLFMEQLACTFGVDSAFVLSVVEGESRQFGTCSITRDEIRLSPFGVLLESVAPVWFDDLSRYALFLRCPWFARSRHRSFCGVPLQDETGSLRGCIALSGTAPREWSHLDSAILRLIASLWRHSGSRSGVDRRGRPMLDRLLEFKAWKGEPSDLRGRDTSE